MLCAYDVILFSHRKMKMQNHITVGMRFMGNYAKKSEPVIKKINIVEILSYQVLRELKPMETESRW